MGVGSPNSKADYCRLHRPRNSFAGCRHRLRRTTVPMYRYNRPAGRGLAGYDREETVRQRPVSRALRSLAASDRNPSRIRS
ncbi:hypothetical protein D8S78_05830 [Natrialba swarupiae]|nr:hypothetical protein [Natrialba swarupiae]